jgi:hypothetical protein
MLAVRRRAIAQAISMTRVTPFAMRARYVAIAISVVLGACTTQGQPGQATIAAPPPPPPVPVNGSYNGIIQLVRGPGMSCGTQDMASFQVANGSVHYVLNQPQAPWQPQVALDAVIAPDGSFQTASGAAYLRGRLSQGHMQGETGGDACGYAFEADRTGTW